MVRKFYLFLLLLVSFCTYAQNMADYTGDWEGEIPHANSFNLTLLIENPGESNASFTLVSKKDTVRFPLRTANNVLQTTLGPNLFFEGEFAKNRTAISGFMKSGMLLYHITLKSTGAQLYSGTWCPLMITQFKSNALYLSVENGEQEDYEAYPIFGDNRFTGTWCANFEKSNDEITFTDFKTGLAFKGKLHPKKIELDIRLANLLITRISLKRSVEDWKIGPFNPDFKLSDNAALNQMETQVLSDSLANVHAVLIAKKNELIYEGYFHGYDSSVPHDMRSASKSISAALMGIAKDQNLFESTSQSIFDFLPEKYQHFNQGRKTDISLQSLLTMSSGLDADDYVYNRTSPAAEHHYQPSADWVKTILSAPIINSPNTVALYGSANPYLLGIAMDSIVPGSLALFMDKALFQPLGITNYIIQTDLNGIPYFAGGTYLTPKAMLKFGQLYLNKGKTESGRIISKKWIKASLKNYRKLENVPEKNGYGYLWWHHNYEVNGKHIHSIEARGAGGQYIFIVPRLKVVAVVTSGNYTNGKTQQPEMIFKNYILPAVMR